VLVSADARFTSVSRLRKEGFRRRVQNFGNGLDFGSGFDLRGLLSTNRGNAKFSWQARPRHLYLHPFLPTMTTVLFQVYGRGFLRSYRLGIAEFRSFLCRMT